MSTITKEFTKEQLIEHLRSRIEHRKGLISSMHIDRGYRDYLKLELLSSEIALASLEAEPVPEWTNKQCLKFLSIAFRHAEINGNLQLDDIRLGVKIVNGSRAAMLQGAEPVTAAYKLSFEQWLSQQTGTIDVECGCVMTEVFFHWLRVAYEAGNSPVIPDCSCGTCRPVTFTDSRFVVCSECGNKRCTHANDHRNACTGSNEPGQEGSAYPVAPQQEVKP